MKNTRILLALVVMIATTVHADADRHWQAWFDETSAQRVGASIVVMEGSSVETINLGTVAVDSPQAPTGRTAFEIGSITKAFTNLLLAELVAKDVVRYDSTIAGFLPEVDFANDAVAAITLQQLATHTSGLPRLPGNLQPDNPADPYADFTPELLMEALATVRDGQPLAHQYAYSNLSVGLLGYVLGRADGTDYPAALQKHILDPLGIDAQFGCQEGAAAGHQGREPTAHWHLDALAGAGALCMSAHELAKVLAPYLRGESALVHALSQDLKVVAAAGPYDVTRVWHVASRGDRSIYWHNGGTGGFRSFVGFNPDTSEGLVLLSNTDADVTSAGIDALLGQPADGAQSDADAPEPRYSEYTGHFLLNPGFSISVFEKDGVLFGQATGQPPLTLGEADPDLFTIMEVDASIRFTRDQNGDVSGLVLNQNGVSQPAPRVDAPVQPKSYEVIEVPESTLDEYTGQYELGPGLVFTIRNNDGQLTAQLTGQGAAPVFPYARDAFFYRVVDAQLTFERDDKGQVTGLILHQNGMDQAARKQ
jgi:CubicO group peptidase (beta-lactamase class C family)